ncbi:hypothetical protein SNE40_023298 [Patella caerulea]|uniref:Uncharacterized protein n=1 Tax=Patella caerulea TaxID=87958 RepID=A0AAN8G2N0_PATCE
MSKRKKHRHCHRRKYNKINTLGPETQTCDLKTNITKHKKIKRKKKRNKSKHDEVKDFNVEPLGSDCDVKDELSLSLKNLSQETRITTQKTTMPSEKGGNSAALPTQNRKQLESDKDNTTSTVKELTLTNSSDFVNCDINIGESRKDDISSEYKTSSSKQHTNITDRCGRNQKKRIRKSNSIDKHENTNVFSHRHGIDKKDGVQLSIKTKKKKKRCQSRQVICGDEHQENTVHLDNMEHRDNTEHPDNMEHRDNMVHSQKANRKNNTEQRAKAGHRNNAEHLDDQTNDDHQKKTHDVESENYKYMVTLYNLWRDVIQQDILIHNQRLQLEKTKLETKQLIREKLNQEEQLAELHLLVGSLNKIIEEKDADISSLKQDFNYIQGLIEDNHGLVINHESLTEIQHRISDGVTMINSLANMLQSGMFDSK